MGHNLVYWWPGRVFEVGASVCEGPVDGLSLLKARVLLSGGSLCSNLVVAASGEHYTYRTCVCDRYTTTQQVRRGGNAATGWFEDKGEGAG